MNENKELFSTTMLHRKLLTNNFIQYSRDKTEGGTNCKYRGPNGDKVKTQNIRIN